MTTVTFNGSELTERFVVADLSRRLIPRTVAMEKVGGMDGEVYRGVTLDSMEISMTLTALGDAYDRSNALRSLAQVLNVAEPCPLYISDDNGKHYLAVPTGGDVDRWLGAERTEVTFVAPEPAMYGYRQGVTVPSGGSANITVYGNTYTRPDISATATRGSSGLWGLRVDGGDYLRVALPTASATSVLVECDRRNLYVGGNVALPTLDSDWLVLTPGTHTISMDQGTGDCSLTWNERWL